MLYSKIALAVVIGAAVSTQVQAAPKSADAQLNEFRAAMQQYVQSLQSELKTAMQAGGPVQAIEVCHQRAPEIATEVGKKSGINIHRTSLKPRQTPAQDWEAEILNWFEIRQQEGANVETLEWHTVSEQAGEKQLHYMKPIVTAGVCLNCHGEHIEPQVISQLNRLYPDDQARGYQEGDLRGAFVLQAPLTD